MNRIVITVIALALASCLTACTTSAPTDQAATSNTDSQGSSSTSPERAVSAEDITWTVEPGSIEGNDMIVFNYTNNSSVDVFGIRLEFRQADGVTDEQRAVFDELYESNSMWEDMNGGKDEVYVGASSERYLQPGESNTTPCTFNFTATPVSSMEQYELMEPKTLSIAYKDGDRVYLEYYDFATDSYSSSSQGDKQAVTWSTQRSTVSPHRSTRCRRFERLERLLLGKRVTQRSTVVRVVRRRAGKPRVHRGRKQKRELLHGVERRRIRRDRQLQRP